MGKLEKDDTRLQRFKAGFQTIHPINKPRALIKPSQLSRCLSWCQSGAGENKRPGWCLLTLSYIEALHGQHPVIIGSIIKSALYHGIVCELLQHPDRFPLPPSLVERCRGTRAHAIWGAGGNSAGLARGCWRSRTLIRECLQHVVAGRHVSGRRL